MYFAILTNFNSADVILDLSSSLTAQVSHLHNKVGNAIVLHLFSLVCFGPERDLQFCFFLFVLLLFITILLLNGSLPLRATGM